MPGSQGPTVKLTFAGDSAQLDRTMQSVGSNADSMAARVGGASDRIRESGDRLDEYADKADTADTRAMGFRDTITGLQDTFAGATDASLPLGERLLTLGMGVGDLASGLANFLIPVLGSFGRMMLTSVIPTVWSFTTALLANPITWIVVGIVALIGTLYMLGAHFDTVKAIATNAVRWIGDRWRDLVGFLGGVARWIGDVFSHVWDGLISGGKWALNVLIDILNGAIWVLNRLIDGINLIPGVNLGHIPNIPKFHDGGVVPGAPGQEVLAILQAGETVTPAGQSPRGGGTAVVFQGNTDSAFATAFMYLVRTGEIQVMAA
ncbi:hypothetical protein ACFWQL_11720 [Amycolatopsis thermoflava]|uniref:hypothetical protein n=1 Tax=Amycolatopsis thermoflava TaxID=84480 RepID=UPI003658BA0A